MELRGLDLESALNDVVGVRVLQEQQHLMRTLRFRVEKLGRQI